jgi:glutamate dehydrogenase
MDTTAGSYFDRLSKRIALRLGDEQEPGLLGQFANVFWRHAPEADLISRSVEDDAGLTIDSWKKFDERCSEEVTISVANPVHARDGWQSAHTVVRIMGPDMSFMVDSALIALSQDGIITHHLNNVVFNVERDDTGVLALPESASENSHKELFIHLEIDRVADDELASVSQRLQKTVADLTAVVEDFAAMKRQLSDIVAQLKTNPPPVDAEELSEALVFLDWLSVNNFTFLGYREFDYVDDVIRQCGTPLGILSQRNRASERKLSDQPESTQAFLLQPTLLSFSKSGTKSRVHRPAYPDYVGIKKFDAEGEVIGEWGFLGLYTSRVYVEHPSDIPVVRRKVASVLQRSHFEPGGFDAKVLGQILATHPRDELFQIDEDVLFETAMAVTSIHERRRIRVFARYESYGLFVNCLVYMPRDLFNTAARMRIQQLLTETFGAEDAEFDIHFSESVHVRLQLSLRIPPGSQPNVDMRALETQITELISDWTTELNGVLLGAFGETRGRRLAREYADAFPAGYREQFDASFAADDIASIRQLGPDRDLVTRFYRLPEDPEEIVKLKIFHAGGPLPLSDIIPKLENMGFRVSGENPFRIRRKGSEVVWIHEYTLLFGNELDISAIDDRFERSFIRTWHGESEDDGFNKLILGAGLTWEQVSLLRTYARYMRQIRFGFGQGFISATLDRHRTLAGRLVGFFEARFHPEQDPAVSDSLQKQILDDLEEVELLNEDRILRRYLELMQATKRTNYFQETEQQQRKRYLAIKVAPGEVSGMPRPLPMFEIFVYAPHFEGVHLRGGKIARGGLRWSDRHEDYRTEVLGLVKAQIVKNGVIVPTGAKGGFVIKAARIGGDLPEVVGCYREFISGLLDLTDNIVQGELLPPPRTRRFDEDDPYLVVAADKGTASFSDEANSVAESYQYWMGDGFASGGSNGYDHKEMGITARGAWISVQRHFLERGIDVQKDPVSVVGIGDMAGDVFGNGMLLSQSIQLVAAFNHLHIFIDPDPDPAASHAERLRLFNLPRSSWEDYGSNLISEGGGIFSRQAKSVAISPQMRACFEIEAEHLAPDDLIHELLKAPVGLIWNGGIGTYVKASSESHDLVGDRANDHLRVDASELQAMVFGEGGNLGMTQSARIEFDLAGGSVNTDFIDNSAGVDCSDHEVNIKIALNEIVAKQDLTNKQRNELLESMTNAVSELVLANNHRQARTLSIASRHSAERLAEYQRFISRMQADAGLDRALEFLPSDDELLERSSQGLGLTRPELAVLLSYSKIFIKSQLVTSDLHQDQYISRVILDAFPSELVDRYEAALLNHRLQREIIASQLANAMVDNMGVTYVVHLLEFVGGTVADVAMAYVAFAESYGLARWIDEIASHPGIEEELKLSMLLELIRLGRRCTRWILRHRQQFGTVEDFIVSYGPRVEALITERSKLSETMRNDNWQQQHDQLVASGVNEELALRSAGAGNMVVALPILNVADETGEDPLVVARVFIGVSQALYLDWLSEQLRMLASASHWQAMERDSLSDEVVTHQAALVARCLTETAGDVPGWLDQQQDFVREWRRIVEELQHSNIPEFSMFSMACRKLNNLCRTL